MIRFAEVMLGSGGPARCVRCHGPREDATYLPAAKLATSLRETCGSWEGRPGPNVMLAGPEPFGHPELPRVVGAAMAAGCARLGLDTDGAALQSRQNAAGALSAGVRHLRVRILAGAPGSHDALAGAPGALDAAVAGLRAFREAADAASASTSIAVLVTVCRHNVHDLPGAVALAVECGADRVELHLDDPGLGLASSAAWIRAACDTGVVNGVWVEVDGMPFCAMPGYELHLSDVLRARTGAKSAACGACALDAVCAGCAPLASADQLAELAPVANGERLAAGIARARAGEATAE